MLDKLISIIKRHDDLQQTMIEQAGTLSHEDYAGLSKEVSGMKTAYELAMTYKSLLEQIAESEELLESETDADVVAMAKEQLSDAKGQISTVDEQLKFALLPTDPNDDKNIFLEIRPAAGGDEAALFASELLKMYILYSQQRGWKLEVVEQSDNDIGGLKFAMLKVSGDSVYSLMKFESGVHRVQRIPQTESQGRVHTSTITVAVMPEAEDVDVVINPKDILMDTFAASSSGGQNANKNQTWVRLRHEPTGLIVTIADSKSQMQNKEKAYAVLKSRIYQAALEEQQKIEQEKRGVQIGTGDRSEKIRTYNYPQDRITDHRIKQSRSNIPWVLSGQLQPLLDALVMDMQTKLLDAANGDSQ